MENDELFRNYSEYLELRHLYTAATREIETRLQILDDEFGVYHSRNPIHHIESRIKENDSIVNKLKKKNLPLNIENAKKHINDIAGIRVVCNYIDDVYYVEKMLLRQSGLKLIKRQNYIENPNYNGYRSLHLDLEVPIYLSDKTEYVMVEVQIRTIAMDFWGSLEHDLRYKANKNIPDDICKDMIESANEIAEIDKRMQEIFYRIQKL